ncbi:DnaD domain protein [Acidaminobacter sp. JC074]|uniref:DnaD domain protein n=1 Tax=Acidaminobacter sp. JC074 TaxID=2530199 RepID=UPI001F0DB70A|nr:DnaD domain protein [Acidaminobacter sp. JC074]MCH4891208.1 DnaD domain protein [Acidaminobacter sp. JC074]
MNYINEINGFRKYLTKDPLAANVQALWYLLMHINNTCGWIEWFKVSNSRLADELCVSDKTVRNLRGILIEKGIILYQSQQRKKHSGLYRMISLESILNQDLDQTAVMVTAESENESKTAVIVTAELENEDKTAVIDSPVSETAVKSAVIISPDSQTAVTVTAESSENKKTAVTITDINKHYYCSNNITTITRDDDFKKLISFYSKNIRPITPYEGEELKSWLDHFPSEVILHALKTAVENGAGNIKYINGILRNWLNKNLLTMDAVNADQRNFEAAKQKGSESKVVDMKAKNKFHNFDQRDKLSNDELERKLGIRK